MLRCRATHVPWLGEQLLVEDDDVGPHALAGLQIARRVRDEIAAREEQRRGRQGLEEGARALLTVLRVRGITVSDIARERILAQQDPEQLARWHERAVTATSLAEVLDELS